MTTVHNARELRKLAHGFNNVLTAILGNAAGLRDSLTEAGLDHLLPEVHEILIATDRAAALARQLYDGGSEATHTVESDEADPHAPVSSDVSATVLLVDDQREVLTFAATVLAREGYRVLVATSAEEALRVWHDSEARIDVLFTDLAMPGGLSGIQLADKLRLERPDLKVLFTSGYHDELSPCGAGAVADGALLPKPYEREALLRCLRESLLRRQLS